MYTLKFLAVFVLVDVAKSQTLSVGKCPNVTVKTDFDLRKYNGTWFENTKNRRYWAIMDSGLKCASETYTIDGSDNIQVVNKGQRILNNRMITVKGVGRVVAPGKLAFSFEDLSFSPKDVPYWVLDTDYDNFAVVWSCTERAGLNAQVTWVLTRQPKPEAPVLRKATDVISRNGLGRTSMIPTLHNSCRASLSDS